ncbi:MAG: hypothetical protein JW884_12435, partial [Deltaproteobacteria bacterium]|nr:hypothetical protein [Deltaproteobacteria bacterium]
MITHLESIVMALIRLLAQVAGIEIFPDRYKTICCDDTLLARRINAAFLVALAGKAHNESNRARAFLEAVLDAPDWTEIATFYRTGIDKIQSEIEETDRINPLFAGQVADVAEWLSAAKEIRFAGDALERIWKISCPEAVGITGNIESLVKILRKKRTVSVEKLNKRPIENPARQVLFTANASFTIPLEETSLDEIPLTGKAVKKLALAIRGQRRFWSYQPVPLGLPPEQNEILQGLQNLDRTMEFERNRGNVSETDRLSCLISVSGTHDELAGISRDLLRDEIARCGGLRKIDVYAFTEEEVRRIVDEVLAPAAIRYLKRDDAAESLAVLGIDGAKGRHFSFLKSMGAFWQVCIDGAIRGTFNLALDQTFPEEELVRESNRSAFEHLMTPLWGATGRDNDGRMLELGMIAGALVNADDIGKGLFTPHVPVPQGPRRIEEYLFFSTL